MLDDDSVIARYIEAYNDSRYEDLRALVAPSYVHHSGPADLSFDGFCRGASWIRSGLPDFRVVVQDQLTDGDRTAVRFTGHGTHTGSFDGETPTGRSVTVYGATVYRFAGGLIVEDWETLDEQPFRDLLGGG
jgi:predicted ester cyclase